MAIHVVRCNGINNNVIEYKWLYITLWWARWNVSSFKSWYPLKMLLYESSSLAFHLPAWVAPGKWKGKIFWFINPGEKVNTMVFYFHTNFLVCTVTILSQWNKRQRMKIWVKNFYNRFNNLFMCFILVVVVSRINIGNSRLRPKNYDLLCLKT